MTNAKITKKALLASVMSLFLCFAMLMGTTYAWFTDSVTSAGNIIKTGTLDVEMYWKDGKTDPTDAAGWTDASTGAIFDYDLWEPGYVEVRHIKIENKGSLALQYKVNIIANGEVTDLAEVIDVYYVDPAQQVADRAALAGVPTIGTLAQALGNLGATGAGELAEGESHVITIALKMREDAGNEYKGKDIGSSFAIQLLATQASVETDAFGPDYDEDAEYPMNILVYQPVETDSNGKTTQDTVMTYTNDAGEKQATVTVPAGTQLEPGADSIVLNITEDDEVHDGVKAILTSEQGAKTYNIDMNLADTNDKEVAITFAADPGLIDAELYHFDDKITSDYDAVTGEISFETVGCSPFTVVHTLKVFDEGTGTKDDPYIIKTAEDLANVSKYYHEYKYFKVADGVKTLDLNGVGNLSLYGSFDGNGVKIVNLTTALFTNVGHPHDVAEIKISNMDVTVNTTNGRALVRNIYNAGNTTFENVAMHGYIEGQYNMGSFYNYGTANHGSSDGSDYTVSFVNATSDVTLVCTTGNVMGGMLGHGYEGADYKLYINMDEKSGYTGKMYTTNGKDCYQVMAMCSHGTYVLNGEEISRYTNTYPSTKLTVVAPVAGENGYTVAPVAGVDHYVVSVNAQITAYDENGVKIANKAGMTGCLGQTVVTGDLDGVILGLVNDANIVNGLDHDYSYEMNDGVLTVYTGRSDNYASGWFTLQVNQYDADGNLLATGIVTVYEIKEVATADKLIAALEKGEDVILTADVELAENVVIGKGVKAKLNLNGYTVTAPAGAICAIQNEGTLTVTGNGTIEGSYTALYSNGNLTIEGGTFTATNGFGVLIDNIYGTEASVAVINGGTFSGLGIYNPTDVTINGGTFNVGRDPDGASDGISDKMALFISPTFVGAPNTANVVLNGGTFNGDVYVYDDGITETVFVNNGATITGEVKDNG